MKGCGDSWVKKSPVVFGEIEPNENWIVEEVKWWCLATMAVGNFAEPP